MSSIADPPIAGTVTVTKFIVYLKPKLLSGFA
jgi:hypothetical protein